MNNYTFILFLSLILISGCLGSSDSVEEKKPELYEPIGCEYDNPPCPEGKKCENNLCIVKRGCNHSNPPCSEPEVCVDNVCIMRAGCHYDNPPCDVDQRCLNNKCIPRAGCIYDNPPCPDEKECKDNICVLKRGCAYSNPACLESEICVNNSCVEKSGCSYDDPPCEEDYACKDNRCVLKTGCAFDNPGCGTDHDCVSNECILKTGCLYSNPPCDENFRCTDNECVFELELTDRTVFLVSDEDWKTVLRLVPLSYKDGGRHPVLIYHKEGENADAYAALSFISSYDPDLIYVVGETPNRLLIDLDNEYAEISSDDLFNFWNDPFNIVVSEDDYETALMASVYAAHMNRPLLFEGEDVSGKYVVAIGNVEGDSHFSLQEVQKTYVSIKGTDKLILVNPDDLYDSVEESIEEHGTLRNLFGKTSLAAPFLAAGKEEVIIMAPSSDHWQIDDFVEDEVERLDMSARYLTIVASPDSIPMSRETFTGECRSGHDYIELDSRYYGSLGENLAEVDLATGRIYGLTVSDASAYVARSLFFDSLSHGESKTLFTASDSFVFGSDPEEDWEYWYNWSKEDIGLDHYLGESTWIWTDDLENRFNSEYDVIEYWGLSSLQNAEEARKEDYMGSSLIVFVDHGSHYGLSNLIHQGELGELNYPIVFASGCHTCDYSSIGSKNLLFCSRNIRHGAMGYLGAVATGHKFSYFNRLLWDAYVSGVPVGEAIRRGKNEDFNNQAANPCVCQVFNGGCEYDSTKPEGDPVYVFLGDPTFVARR